MTECFLSDQEIRKLNRDLRILIAANGTLTRVLNIVADDEVIVQIVKQRIHDVSPKLSEFEQLGQVGVGRVLQRYSLGRRFARLARAPRVSEFPKESRCPPLSRYFRRPADHGGDGALSTKRISRCSA